MAQNEQNNPLGAMVSEILQDPQKLQQFQQMAASLGLGSNPPPASVNNTNTANNSPDLSGLLAALNNADSGSAGNNNAASSAPDLSGLLAALNNANSANAGNSNAAASAPDLSSLLAALGGTNSGLAPKKPVINATGVVLHTNLGRARLSKAAREAVIRVASSYCNLEYDIEKGKRGHRHDLVEKIICRITGAEAAMAVNNNAAATMLCLSALGRGRQVIVSRGELVEIGGSFRVPEIMEESGCTLREVGTTNKTKISDYERAVCEETAALMKVHTSNYRILGFTEDVSLEQMVKLGREKDLPVIFDMGNGLIVDLSAYGIDEPNVEASLKTGIDVILFSGDKLLGGPQCGIIAGKREYVEKMKRHPLARAFRVDKLTLAALEMTFRAYYDREKALKEIPVLRDITVSQAELRMKAEAFAQSLRDEKTIEGTIDVEPIEDQVGGGSAPTVKLKGWAVSLKSESIKPEKLDRLLRKQEPAAIIRMGHDKAYFDVRTLMDDDLEVLKRHLRDIFERAGEQK